MQQACTRKAPCIWLGGHLGYSTLDRDGESDDRTTAEHRSSKGEGDSVGMHLHLHLHLHYLGLRKVTSRAMHLQPRIRRPKNKNKNSRPRGSIAATLVLAGRQTAAVLPVTYHCHCRAGCPHRIFSVTANGTTNICAHSTGVKNWFDGRIHPARGVREMWMLEREIGSCAPGSRIEPMTRTPVVFAAGPLRSPF